MSFINTTGDKFSFLSWHKLVAIVGIIIGSIYYLEVWKFTPDGISGVTSTTAYWDFNNLWAGSRFAIQGHVDWLFDMSIYRPEMDKLFGMDIPNQEWSYPPNMLLIGAPLALLPALPAYIIWTLGSLALLYLAIRPFNLAPYLQLAILLSPPVFLSAVFGQNGTMISALLIMGLYYAPKRPLIAGLCIGLLTVKPQFGLIIPFILIAGGYWRTFFVASMTTISMFIITGLLFGFGVWENFMAHTQPMMRGIMEAPFYQQYQANAVTPFIFFRAIGADLFGAYSGQFIVSLGCIVFGYWLWRPQRDISHQQRLALTCVLIMLSTPYAYTYDLVAAYAGIVLFVASSKRLYWQPLFAAIWFFPLYNHLLSWHYYVNVGLLFVLSLFILLYLTWRRERLMPPLRA